MAKKTVTKKSTTKKKLDPLAHIKEKMKDTELYMKWKAKELDLRMTLFLQLKNIILTKEEFVRNNMKDFELSLDSVKKEIKK